MESRLKNNINLTVDEVLYQKAKEYCRKLNPEARGDIYYALLDWCDQHKDIAESLTKKYDIYVVVYIDCNGDSHREEFVSCNGENPFKFARQRYGELLKRNVEVMEFRRCPNPYLSYPSRLGELILSYERK